MRLEIVVRNSAKCLLCGEEVESTHRHHFNPCKCGALTVDGGQAYRRRLFQAFDQWIDTSILAEEPATREQLAEAAEMLAFARTGLVPPETDWADAPLLEGWRIVEARVPPARDDMQELEGDVLGHPDFRDGQRIRTTPILFAPNGKAWARTVTGYFRLGTPAKGSLN